MQSWNVQEAKTHFSELLDTCIEQGPQLLTRRGTETAVVVPIDEWRRLLCQVRPSLKELLLSEENRHDFEICRRGQARRRSKPVF